MPSACKNELEEREAYQFFAKYRFGSMSKVDMSVSSLSDLFRRRNLSYPMYIHLFYAEDITLLFICVCQFLAKVFAMYPQLILLYCISVTFLLENPTMNIAVERRPQRFRLRGISR